MNTFDETESENYVAFDEAMPVAPAGRDILPPEINPDAPHWSSGAALGILILSVVSLFIFSAVAVFFYFLINGFQSAGENLASSPLLIFLSLVSTFPAHLVTLLAAWVLVTRNGKQPFFQTLGWDWRKNLGVWSILGILITGGIYLIALLIIKTFGGQENKLDQILKSSQAAVYAIAILATFTAPLVEEVVFRGILYPALKLKLGIIAAIILTTFFFAVIHVPQYVEFDKMQNPSNYTAISVILMMSLILTVIRALTKSLLPSFIIHTMFNGVQAVLLIVALYLPKSVDPIEPVPSIIFKTVSFFN